MTLLEWRPAHAEDASALQCFECTTRPKRLRRPPYGYAHEAHWEYAVQRYIRGLKPRVGPSQHLWVGLDSHGLGAVSFFEQENGPREFFIKAMAIALRHRRRGGGVADELMRVTLDEMTSLAIGAGVEESLISAHIDESNRPSQRLARAAGFQQTGADPPLQVWQTRLVYPPEAFQEELF